MLILSKYEQLAALGMIANKGGGGSGSAGGGASGSGKVDYPAYLKDIHQDLLQGISDEHVLDEGISMVEAVEEAWDNSPYSDATAYNPTTDLNLMDVEFNNLRDMADDLNHITDHNAMLDAAVTQATTILGAAPTDMDVEPLLMDEELVDGVVEAYEQRQYNAGLRARSRLNAGFADINAVNSSAFIIANAMLEHEHVEGVGRFNAEASLAAARMNAETRINVARFNAETALKVRGERLILIQAIAAEFSRLFSTKIELRRTVAAMMAELKRMRLVAMTAYYDSEIELSSKDAMWRISIFEPAGNLLAAHTGGTVTPSNAVRKESSGTSMLGGALSGAASLGLIAATGGMATPLVAGAALLGGGMGAMASSQ